MTGMAVGDTFTDASGQELTVMWDGSKGSASLLGPRSTRPQDYGDRRVAVPTRQVRGRASAMTDVDDREIGRTT
jgi:hypothetical protein